MTAAHDPSDTGRDPRQAAVRTAWILGAVALAFFVAAFLFLPR